MSEFSLRAFALDLHEPLGTAKGNITERRGLLVGVEREEGGETIRGVGEAAPLTPWTESYEECAESLRALAETETDERDGDGDGDDSNDSGFFDTLGPAARHGVTLAASDAAARARGVSLAHYLAQDTGDVAETVPVNATVGDGSVEETVERAETAVDDGFDCLKLKVGAQDLDTDLDRLRAVRDAVGDDVTLRADANGAWTREEAERALDVLAELDFTYVEQPLAADDLQGHAELRGHGVDIALDESVNRVGDAPQSLADIADTTDIVVLKPMAQGGPRATVAFAQSLQSQDVTPVVTTTIDAVVARTAAVHVAAAIPDVPPCGLATASLLAEELADDPCPVVDGAVDVPDGPGLAFDAFDSLV